MKKKSKKSIQMDYIEAVVKLYFSVYSVLEAVEKVKEIPNSKNEVIECLEKIITK